jgi:hypothetical protein
MFAQPMCRYRRSRAGVSGVSLLIALPVLLALIGLVVYVGLLRDVRYEAQGGADAAALAGARLLADDTLLLREGYQTLMQTRVRQARQMAQTIGQLNFAGDERLSLDLNDTNDPEGDIVIGQLDRPLGGTFRPLPPDVASWDNSAINAVRVTVRRSALPGLLWGQPPRQAIVARATAFLDWRVVGYRPSHDRPIPLIPIALYSDPSGNDLRSWEGQWHRRQVDTWSYDGGNQRWQVGSDGLPEIFQSLGGTSPTAGPALFLQIGVEDFAETLQQIQQGIRRSELERQFGAGGFVLRGDNRVNVPGAAGLPPVGSQTRTALLETLQNVASTGQARLWPLYSEYDTLQGQVRVSGWTAARLVEIQTQGANLLLVLQPCVLPHAAAVTEQREPPPAFWENNRMVCRVRLAE